MSITVTGRVNFAAINGADPNGNLLTVQPASVIFDDIPAAGGDCWSQSTYPSAPCCLFGQVVWEGEHAGQVAIRADSSFGQVAGSPRNRSTPTCLTGDEEDVYYADVDWTSGTFRASLPDHLCGYHLVHALALQVSGQVISAARMGCSPSSNPPSGTLIGYDDGGVFYKTSASLLGRNYLRLHHFSFSDSNKLHYDGGVIPTNYNLLYPGEIETCAFCSPYVFIGFVIGKSGTQINDYMFEVYDGIEPIATHRIQQDPIVWAGDTFTSYLYQIMSLSTPPVRLNGSWYAVCHSTPSFEFTRWGRLNSNFYPDGEWFAASSLSSTNGRYAHSLTYDAGVLKVYAYQPDLVNHILATAWAREDIVCDGADLNIIAMNQDYLLLNIEQSGVSKLLVLSDVDGSTSLLLDETQITSDYNSISGYSNWNFLGNQLCRLMRRKSDGKLGLLFVSLSGTLSFLVADGLIPYATPYGMIHFPAFQGGAWGNNAGVLWLAQSTFVAACKTVDVAAPSPLPAMRTTTCSSLTEDCGGGKGRGCLSVLVTDEGTTPVPNAKIHYVWETSTGQKGDGIAESDGSGYAECWTSCYDYDYTVTITIHYVEHSDFEWDPSQSCYQTTVAVTAP